MRRGIFQLIVSLLFATTQVYAANGNLQVDGSVGVGTTTDPLAKLEVKGEIKVGNTGLVCNNTLSGTMRYNATSNAIEFCNGTSWSALGAGSTTTTTTTTTPPPPADTTPPITSASPPEGSYPSIQTVTLTANEPATIYYTTNGTTPTTSSAVYSSPLTISANTSLSYFAKDTAGNIETVKTQTYLIGTNQQDTGSIIQTTPGTYTHMFTSNATVTVAYLKGGGANYQWDTATENSYITLGGVGKAVAYGGFDGDWAPTDGTATNTIGGTNIQYGAANTQNWDGTGELSEGQASGGEVVGGTFNVVAGQLLTVVVGSGAADDGEGNDFAGGDGSVSLSWH